ncbi:MAG: putative DNA binding domain-containing protein [Firmicutes bacterium]|nr:putative DNA binding domain-containing protein [Bacillota bacterium]
MISKEYFGESKTIEFKREIPKNHEKFLKDIVAFANTSGGKCII